MNFAAKAATSESKGLKLLVNYILVWKFKKSENLKIDIDRKLTVYSIDEHYKLLCLKFQFLGKLEFIR